VVSERTKPEGLAYLEARAETLAQLNTGDKGLAHLEAKIGGREGKSESDGIPGPSEALDGDFERLEVCVLPPASVVPLPLTQVPKVFEQKTLGLDLGLDLSAEARPGVVGLQQPSSYFKDNRRVKGWTQSFGYGQNIWLIDYPRRRPSAIACCASILDLRSEATGSVVGKYSIPMNRL
jgi:hypothetical protein